LDEEHALALEQLGAAETTVDALAELLREMYTDGTGNSQDIEDLFEELELDL
jgi:hypothetical protein